MHSAPVGLCRSFRMSSRVRRRDQRARSLEVEREAVGALDVAVGHRDAAEELDQRAVDGKARVGVEHLVAGVHEGQQELADHRLAARLRRYVSDAVAQAVRGADVGGDASRSSAIPALGQ